MQFPVCTWCTSLDQSNHEKMKKKNGQKLIQLQAGIGTKKEDPRRILKAKKKNLWTKELLWCKCAPKCFFLFQRLFIRLRLHCKNNCWISIKWAILHCTKHINFWFKWVIIRFTLFCGKKRSIKPDSNKENTQEMFGKTIYTADVRKSQIVFFFEKYLKFFDQLKISKFNKLNLYQIEKKFSSKFAYDLKTLFSELLINSIRFILINSIRKHTFFAKISPNHTPTSWGALRWFCDFRYSSFDFIYIGQNMFDQ